MCQKKKRAGNECRKPDSEVKCNQGHELQGQTEQAFADRGFHS